MFTNRTDFFVGLAVGVVAGVFGYKMMVENGNTLCNLIPAPQNKPQDGPSLEELMQQKERLEDLIAEKQVANA
jgi:hypothetical protein